MNRKDRNVGRYRMTFELFKFYALYHFCSNIVRWFWNHLTPSDNVLYQIHAQSRGRKTGKTTTAANEFPTGLSTSPVDKNLISLLISCLVLCAHLRPQDTTYEIKHPIYWIPNVLVSSTASVNFSRSSL